MVQHWVVNRGPQPNCPTRALQARERRRLLCREGAGSSAAMALAVLRGERTGRLELVEGAGSSGSSTTTAAALAARGLTVRRLVVAAGAGSGSGTAAAGVGGAAAAASADRVLRRVGLALGVGALEGATMRVLDLGNQGTKQEVVFW